MLDPSASEKVLLRLFRRDRVAEIETLFSVLETRSRMSVFRRLKQLDYRSSFTHNGCYYTLVDIARFDADGIWFHRGVGFSDAGTLKATVVDLVQGAAAGLRHQELRGRVRVRVHNTLLELVRSKRIQRESVCSKYLYLSVDADRAAQQLARRHEQMAEETTRSFEPPPSLVIEVLSEVLQTARLKVNADEIASRLCARGVEVAVAEVELILESYGVGKKGARRRSRRSKR